MASFETEPFGRYFLVDKVATGGMAEVFKAKSFSHGGFEKLLVIKRILEHLSDNDEFVEMFIDEAKITVSLQHPNIVQIYDFGKIHDNYFLSMECVEGKDVKGILRKLARRRKLLPTEFAVYVAHEMCKGLDYAHKKADAAGNPLRIIHRDISPSNILVSYTGEVKIADFGIAKAESSAYDTKDGVLKGKFEYMSPEQASGRDLDPRSDIFSAGIILHEMLTGRRLFKTDSDVKTLEKIKAVDIQPPSALNPAVPARLDEIVMKALSRDREDRYEDARAMQQALLEFMYPQTPDLTRESLSHFMQELFSEEIEGEKDRLAEGSAVAAEMYAQAPEQVTTAQWDAVAPTTAGGTLAEQPPPAPSSKVPLFVAVAAVLLLLGTVAFFMTRPEPEAEIIRETVTPTTSTVQLQIRPADAPAVVTLGGVEVGRGSSVLAEELEPAPGVELRIEAEGFEEWVDSVDLVAGERLRQTITLTPLAEEPPERPVVEAPVVEAPVVEEPVVEEPVQVQVEQVVVTARFRSEPAGAAVLLDGRRIGSTPLDWRDGAPGASHSVVMRLDGYEDASLTARLPGSGSETFSATLTQKAVAPGTLRVFAGKSGPATVYVDGEVWGESPPVVQREVPPGSYSVRVVPKDGSQEQSRSVKVESGAKAMATF